MAIAVLVNPSAGKGRHRAALPGVLDRLRKAGEVNVLSPHTAKEAKEMCAAAVADGAQALVAVGGDGTFHLALQAVAGTEVALGVIPAGTGNDFVTCLGLPLSMLDAADVVAAGRTQQVDLGRINGTTWFGGVIAAGFDAIVNERANRMRWPRGPQRYDVAIALELMRLKPRRYRFTLDGVAHEVDAVLVAIGNTSSYGGGMKICPAADTGDGLLDLVLAGPVSRTALVRMKPSVYKGTHVAHPAVQSFRARRIEIDADDITIYADGERISPLPAVVEIVPAALRLLR